MASGAEFWGVDASNGRRHVLVEARHLQDLMPPPASRGQQTGLGRVEPPRYLWAPSGQALLFISARELTWYDLKSGSAKKLLQEAKGEAASGAAGGIHDAQVSPEGQWVSFLRRHSPW